MRLRVLFAIHGPADDRTAVCRAVASKVEYLRRTPWEPVWLKALAPRLWPFGRHSVLVAEKPAAMAGGAR
jgi:hypothetical protein